MWACMRAADTACEQWTWLPFRGLGSGVLLARIGTCVLSGLDSFTPVTADCQAVKADCHACNSARSSKRPLGMALGQLAVGLSVQ